MLRSLLITLFLLLFNLNLAHAESKAIIYEFYAPWCHTCRDLAPKIAALERQGVHVVRVNIDENTRLMNRYHVVAVPTVILVKNGREVERLNGDVSLKALENLAAHAEE